MVFLVGMAGAWGWRWYRLNSAASTALPVYGTVGDLVLIERSGQPLSLADLKGRISIVNFFFSRCTEICPRTMPQMARLQDALAEADVLAGSAKARYRTPIEPTTKGPASSL